jgi:endonuclease III
MPLTGKNLPAFRRSLLHWYDQNRRDLPWRRSRDPYRIWLSEIMLQQTRVAAVLDHYRIFLERFPNVQSLAAASEDAVLAAWSGLGYYRRARMLHQCARELAQKHAGRFPQRAEDLQNLPGIGRYTAAAVASIAFAEPIAVVDGNVERVVQRFLGGHRTRAGAACPLAARRLQSGDDGARRNRVRAGRTPMPGLPYPEMVRHAAVSPSGKPPNHKRTPLVPVRQNATLDSSGEEEHLVSAQPAQWQNPPRATAKEGLTHARHVGIAAIIRASTSVAPGRAVAHVSPFHHRYRLHSARASECGVNQCRSCRQK